MTLTFDILTSKYNQFIFVPNCTQGCKYGEIPTSVKISCSQTIDLRSHKDTHTRTDGQSEYWMLSVAIHPRRHENLIVASSNRPIANRSTVYREIHQRNTAKRLSKLHILKFKSSQRQPTSALTNSVTHRNVLQDIRLLLSKQTSPDVHQFTGFYCDYTFNYNETTKCNFQRAVNEK